MIKKHIKKALCLVAILAIMVVAFVVPSMAYYVEDLWESYGVNNYGGICTITNEQGQEDVDALPLVMWLDYDGNVSVLSDNYVVLNRTSPSSPWRGMSIITDPSIATFHFNDIIEYRTEQSSLQIVDGEYECEFSAYDRDGVLLYQGSFSGVYNNVDYGYIYRQIVNSGLYEGITEYIVYDYIDVYEEVGENDLHIVIPLNTEYNGAIGIADLNHYTYTYVDDVPIGQFLWDSVNAFMSFEIIEGVSLYIIFMAIVAIPLTIWFLKLVAGG